MTVAELIKLLKTEDPGAEVVVADGQGGLEPVEHITTHVRAHEVWLTGW